MKLKTFAIGSLACGLVCTVGGMFVMIAELNSKTAATVTIAPKVSAPAPIAPKVSAPAPIAPKVSAPAPIAPKVSAPAPKPQTVIILVDSKTYLEVPKTESVTVSPSDPPAPPKIDSNVITKAVTADVANVRNAPLNAPGQSTGVIGTAKRGDYLIIVRTVTTPDGKLWDLVKFFNKRGEPDQGWVAQSNFQ